jgi:hypothetical protein
MLSVTVSFVEPGLSSSPFGPAAIRPSDAPQQFIAADVEARVLTAKGEKITGHATQQQDCHTSQRMVGNRDFPSRTVSSVQKKKF